MQNLIKFIFISLIISFSWSLNILSQQTKKSYRENQHSIDKNFGGIGVTLMQPDFGKGVEIPKRWYGVNLLSDYFEAEFMVGEVDKIRPISRNDENPFAVKDYGKDYGYLLSIGASTPLRLLTFGAYKSPTKVLRGHPTVGANLGFGRFKKADLSSGKTNLYFFGINAGYRIRIPVGSLEFNVKSRLGWSGVDDVAGTGFNFYKGTGISPSITLRLDAMKGLFNPRMVSAKVAQASVSNVQSKTQRTGSRYVGNSRVDTYSTTTTGTVSVTSSNVGVQDIGPHFGIGPKVSFMNPIRSTHIEPSYLIGVAAEGRANVLDYGFTLEGGNVGHGSAIKFTGIDEPKKRLNKKESTPLGSVSIVSLYGNFGFDISPLFLMPFGIAIDKGESTSFFSATAGFNLGVHTAFNQQYYDPVSAEEYRELAENSDYEVKDKFLDPSIVGSGVMGGLYFSLQVGAASFKVSNHRYSGAPFASTTMLSVAWRFPLKLQD